MSRVFGAKKQLMRVESEMRKGRVAEDGREGWRITMGHVALLGLFGTSLSPVASGY